jgi:putative membrane-bound dehydrogenase-like protein
MVADPARPSLAPPRFAQSFGPPTIPESMRNLALCLVLLLARAYSPAPAQAQSVAAVDREYTLEASMLGFRGVGGEIAGVRNPVLRAEPGETVRITIVGVEVLPHDLKLEKLGAKTTEVVDVGDRASLTFTASEDDVYFCTIPGHRAAGMEGRIEVAHAEVAAGPGFPVVQGGKPMNLGMETGTLQDWIAAGEAFTQQSAGAAAGDPQLRHEGAFWASSGDTLAYQAAGTLTSSTFTVTQPFAAFQVAGGALKDTRVELVRADDDSVFFEISGYGSRTLRPVVVDLAALQGKRIYIRLIDRESGLSGLPYIADNKLAYIGFDDFRFYPTRPAFPNELRPSEIQILPPLDVVKYAGLSGPAAAAAMEVPEGFKVTLAAAEPDIVRPIAFTLDDRGRLWVVEAHTYPVRAPEGQGKDRILIFEDTDGDGTLDSRKVFTEGLNLVSGIEVGFGGVWVGAAPYLLFIPMKEGTDRPSGPPQVMLDGWGLDDTHETLNSLRWGPDGWLYGTQGVFTYSNVGKPGAPDSARVKLNAGVWRYHPTKHLFELYAEGTSNPWGLDFDDYGQAFLVGCVIPHLFHVIQGAHYDRQAGEHFNPYVFDDLPTIADHRHWVGTYGPHAGNNRSNAVGGGHAHAGAMVYLGGSWPEEYRNQIMMNNVHGARTNADILERRGSGYVGHHGADFLVANDSWSQLINLRYGPDGSVYLIDWYDKNQCHSPNPDVHQKTLGRIYKVSYKDDRPVKVDLQKLNSQELVALQLHRNDWYVRHARRILQERGPDPAVHAALKRILRENPDVTRRLRALWALHVTDGLSDAELTALLSDRDEYVRGWTVQLLAEDERVPAEAVARMAVMAREDSSPLVRLYLAAGLQRIPREQRWDVLSGLASHAGDVDDHNLPLMIWYAAEPMATANMDRALELALEAELPTLLPYTVRRVAALDHEAAIRALSAQLGRVTDAHQRVELLKGLNQLVGAQPAPAGGR